MKKRLAAVVALIVLTGSVLTGFSVSDPAEKGRRIPILMYHALAETPWSVDEGLFVRPEEFEAQLRILLEKGYETVTFDDFSHINDYSKPILLTFDDGYEDNYTVLFPILQKYGCKATIFMIAGSVGRERFLSAAQLREMSDSGLVSIQSHTQNHPSLGEPLTAEALDRELAGSRRALEEVTGRPVTALAYPYGRSTPENRRAAGESYGYAVTNTGGKFHCGDDVLRMSRVRVNRFMELKYFAALF